MNKRELERIRRKNFNKLDIAYKPKINAVELNISNSIKHELVKTICVWLIRKGVAATDLDFAVGQILCASEEEEPMANLSKEKITELISLNNIRIVKDDYRYEWQRPQVVTEARFQNKRRADIFILDTGEIVEIETNPRVRKEGATTISI